jgi:hypothetical protein
VASSYVATMFVNILNSSFETGVAMDPVLHWALGPVLIRCCVRPDRKKLLSAFGSKTPRQTKSGLNFPV